MHDSRDRDVQSQRGSTRCTNIAIVEQDRELRIAADASVTRYSSRQPSISSPTDGRRLATSRCRRCLLTVSQERLAYSDATTAAKAVTMQISHWCIVSGTVPRIRFQYIELRRMMIATTDAPE